MSDEYKGKFEGGSWYLQDDGSVEFFSDSYDLIVVPREAMNRLMAQRKVQLAEALAAWRGHKP